MPRRTVRLRITGRVQGVWYRGWTVETATALGLDGWVRNRADGSVEAVFHGDADAVEAMLARAHDGPPSAKVESIDVQEHDQTPAPGFHQRPTD